MPNSEVKRRSADGSVGSPHARVGNCQASNKTKGSVERLGLSFYLLFVGERRSHVVNGLIYYPHPETKPEHFQPPDILEFIGAFIPNLYYDDQITIEVDFNQIEVF